MEDMENTENALTLEKFGALLREKRLRKGLTEENVADELKITSRLVRAIEAGDRSSMPHAVYARGFVRAYAQFLSLDSVLTHAACALLKDPEETLREQELIAVASAPRRESNIPWLAILLCAAFLAGGAWYLRDVIPGLFTSSSTEKNVPAQNVPARTAPAQTPLTGRTDTAPITPEPTANATLPATPDNPIILGGTPLPAENATAPTAPAAPAAGHQITLTADADCWVSTTADGKNSQRIMHKGDTLTVDFEEKLVMKLGNAGAVRVGFDGRDLPPIGKLGRVKKVTFPDDFTE